MPQQIQLWCVVMVMGLIQSPIFWHQSYELTIFRVFFLSIDILMVEIRRMVVLCTDCIIFWFSGKYCSQLYIIYIWKKEDMVWLLMKHLSTKDQMNDVNVNNYVTIGTFFTINFRTKSLVWWTFTSYTWFSAVFSKKQCKINYSGLLE